MLSCHEAVSRVLAACAPLGTERVAIGEALGRALAKPLVASRPLPPVDNSAMDGFAVRAADTPGTLPIAQAIAAGDAPGDPLPPGAAARITTGAPVPPGADAVVMREDAEDRDGEVVLRRAASQGENIRRLGEDVGVGDEVLPAGARLGAGALALAAALGHADVEVGRRPRVAIASTGDELVEVGQIPGPGQIVNSNACALAAQIREAGGVPEDLGIVPDEPAATRAAIARGLGADVLVTSGGVSVGEHDHVKAALERSGVSVLFWKVAIKPGKPIVFGVAPGGALVFGLPGNPVSSMVGFELFVRPALRALEGGGDLLRPRAPAVLARPYPKKPGRAHYARAILTRRGGVLEADVFPKQGSGMLSSMALADALVELGADAGDVPAGAEVPAILLRAI